MNIARARTISDVTTQIKFTKNQNLINILEFFAKTAKNLRILFHYRHFVSRQIKKNVNYSTERNIYKCLTPVLRYEIIMRFSNVSDALLTLLAFYDVFN